MQRIISTFISRGIISLLLLFSFASNGMAQEKEVAAKADSTELLQSITVGYDLVGAGMLLFSDYGHHEIFARANLKNKYFPVIEVGLGRASHDDDVTGIHYDTSAPYFRIGCDMNLLRDKQADHKVFAGARYAFTSFKANISSADFIDPIWQTPVSYNIDGEKCSQHWLELALGIDTKIYGPVHLGWSVRYRHRIAHDEGPGGKVWYIPGYGVSDSSVITATFNVSVLLDRSLWKRKSAN